jgi:hypothetical protein
MPETNCLKPNRFSLLTAIAQVLICPVAFLVSFSGQSDQRVQAQPSDLENITIGPRFSPNPLEIRGVGGGSVSVKEIAGVPESPTGSCTGFTSTKPNHTLVLTSFFDSLSLQVQSAEDTALAIKGPGGVWCNDDYQGKDPGVAGQWLPGTYRIWIASYAKNRRPAYVLRINESR